MGLFPEIFQKILDHTVEGEHLRHFTAMRCAQRSHTNMTRAVRRISARSPHTALVGAQHQRGFYHVLEGGHLLLAEHRLDEREDALARRRAGRDGITTQAQAGRGPWVTVPDGLISLVISGNTVSPGYLYFQ